MHELIPTDDIEQRIFLIRRRKVMIDSHLAELYQVPTKVLNQAIKRHEKRFPRDFMFRLTPEEVGSLKSRVAISNWGGRRYLPLVFTEQGVAMLSSILNSERAIQVNIEIMRAFVKLRRILTAHKNLARRLDELERKYDVQFKVVFDAIRELMARPEKPRRVIGFHP